MKCPKCGKEMEEGRLTAGGYWIRWLPAESVPFLTDHVTISPLSLSGKGVDADLCKDCRMVIAKY